MPVPLSYMHEILFRGMKLDEQLGFKIKKSMLNRFPLIADIYNAAKVTTYGDLLNLPRDINGASGRKYTITTKSSWEYPQGCGRVVGYDECPRNSEGKVEVFQDVFNKAYEDLRGEISAFEDWMLKQVHQ